MSNDLITYSDSLLWNDFKKGNHEAFHAVYKNHVQTLYKYGCNFTQDKALVKDCIHDVFIDLVKYRSALGATNNIKLYLFKSLKRKIVKSLYKRKRFKALEKEDIAFRYDASAEDEIVEDISTQTRSKKLIAAMVFLSPRQREAIYLKFVSNLSYEEISILLEINYQSARNLIFRGVEKLRAALPKEIILVFL
ncbi:MAG: RNA polymerase sigma factor [Prolixibacteraceae bacterium]